MTRTQRGDLALAGALVVAIGLGSVDCGAAAQPRPDGGGDGSINPDAITGRRSFDVVAALKAAASGSPAIPATNEFTLVLDADTRSVIVGANGVGSGIDVTTVDGRTFQSSGSFWAASTVGDACDLSSSALYDSFEVTVGDGTLTGTAEGTFNLSCGDCAVSVPFTATLTGTRDMTSPALRPTSSVPASPFDSFGFATTEPLPANATARLVADDGEAIDLLPTIPDGNVPLIEGFSKPDVVLRAGHGYVVSLDGLVDFAGLRDTAGVPLRVASFPDAPMAVEDGFESVTDGAFGGAMTMRGGPLPAISGNTSLYIGGMGAPALDATNGRSLMVRMARQPGDTVLRFSFRVVATRASAGFSGSVRIGAEGASASTTTSGLASGSGDPEMITLGQTTVFASPVAVKEAPLPVDATDEVLVVIAASSGFCVPFDFTAGIGLLIDDLRLE